jgi:endonuclease/exonuclease/phosphatase (EEP) superfamily protein YafD
LLVNLIEIAPWYLPQLSDNPTTEGQSIRVILSNINKYSAKYPQVIALVEQENPDIAVLLEVGKVGVERLESLRKQFPYFVAHQDVDIDGTAIYSKLPLLDPSVRSLGGGRKAVKVEIATESKAAISLVAVHPSNAVDKAYVEEQNRQLMEIADYVKKLNNP